MVHSVARVSTIISISLASVTNNLVERMEDAGDVTLSELLSRMLLKFGE